MWQQLWHHHRHRHVAVRIVSPSWFRERRHQQPTTILVSLLALHQTRQATTLPDNQFKSKGSRSTSTRTSNKPWLLVAGCLFGLGSTFLYHHHQHHPLLSSTSSCWITQNEGSTSATTSATTTATASASITTDMTVPTSPTNETPVTFVLDDDDDEEEGGPNRNLIDPDKLSLPVAANGLPVDGHSIHASSGDFDYHDSDEAAGVAEVLASLTDEEKAQLADEHMCLRHYRAEKVKIEGTENTIQFYFWVLSRRFWVIVFIFVFVFGGHFVIDWPSCFVPPLFSCTSVGWNFVLLKALDSSFVRDDYLA